jgi:hypothetical protein
MLSARLKQYYGRLRRPPGQPSTSRGHRLQDTALRQRDPQAAGTGRASPVPAVTIGTFRAPYAGESFAAALPGSSPLPWPSPWIRGLGSPCSRPKARPLATPQASLNATDRTVAPPVTGPLTPGSDPARFQAKPPACYRASWQLPGPDSHRQATTSLRHEDPPWLTSRCHLPLCWAHERSGLGVKLRYGD